MSDFLIGLTAWKRCSLDHSKDWRDFPVLKVSGSGIWGHSCAVTSCFTLQYWNLAFMCMNFMLKASDNYSWFVILCWRSCDVDCERCNCGVLSQPRISKIGYLPCSKSSVTVIFPVICRRDTLIPCVKCWLLLVIFHVMHSWGIVVSHVWDCEYDTFIMPVGELSCLCLSTNRWLSLAYIVFRWRKVNSCSVNSENGINGWQ